MYTAQKRKMLVSPSHKVLHLPFGTPKYLASEFYNFQILNFLYLAGQILYFQIMNFHYLAGQILNFQYLANP